MNPKEHPSWSKIVRAARLRAKGRTQKQTADALNVVRRTVIRWESRPELWKAAQLEAGVTPTVEGDGGERDSVTGGDDTPENAGGTQVIPMRKKGTSRNAGPHGVPMRTPKHGKGKLMSGNPYAQGGTPSELRKRLRGSMRDRINVLEEIADDPQSKPSDRLKAIDLIAKYGLGKLTELSTEHVRGKLVETIAIVREELDEADADRVLTRMREVWR